MARARERWANHPKVVSKILVGEAIERKHHPHAGIAKQPFQLASLGPGAESDDDGADDRRTEEYFQPFQPVVHQQPDAIPPANALPV